MCVVKTLAEGLCEGALVLLHRRSLRRALPPVAYFFFRVAADASLSSRRSVSSWSSPEFSAGGCVSRGWVVGIGRFVPRPDTLLKRLPILRIAEPPLWFFLNNAALFIS